MNGGALYLATIPKNSWTNPEYEDIKYEKDIHVPKKTENRSFLTCFLLSKISNQINANKTELKNLIK